MERCCGFTIETGSVIIATKHALQMICGILFLGFELIFRAKYLAHYSAFTILWRFLVLILAIGILCISILSIRGIEARKHRRIMPMMIWLVIAVVTSFVLLILIVMDSYYIWITVLYAAFVLLSIALDVFGIVAMYNLYKKFRVQPTAPPSQFNQQPLQCTENV